MSTLLFIGVAAAAAGIGVLCGWSAFRHRIQDRRLLPSFRSFLFHLWLGVVIVSPCFLLIPEQHRIWLVIPLLVVWAVAVFRFRREAQKYVV
jgi:hypothetical protein